MTDLEFYVLLAINIATFLLFYTFLYGFYKLRSIIKPLMDKYVTESGGLKLPNWKQAIGYMIMKAADSVDFSKVMGGFGKGPK